MIPYALPKYIPQLDTLRAFAVLAVIICHSRSVLSGNALTIAGWGWVGVDLFFVLSGFLITGILLDSKGADKYFTNFYARRILRIWPLYFGILILVFGATVLTHSAVPSRWPTYFLFMQNFVGQGDSLMNTSKANYILNPTWSLCVEEQFYMIWPLMVSLCSRRVLKVTIGTLFLLSPFIRLVSLHYGSPEFMYDASMCRLDGLLAGAAAAILIRERVLSSLNLKKIGIGLVAVFGALSLLSLAYFSPADQGKFSPALFSLLALCFVGVLLVSITTKWTFYPLRYVGRVSYGIYLLHYGVIQALAKSPVHRRLASHPWVEIAINIGVVTLLAALSWELVESKILRLKRKFDPKPVERLTRAVVMAA